MELWEKAEHDPKGLDVKRVGGSGSGVIKGDQIGKHLMVEVKTVQGSRYIIVDHTIWKMQKQAASQGKMPVMRVDFMVGHGSLETTVAVLPWETFLAMMSIIDDCE